MRGLLLAVCLIASVCAYHLEVTNVVVKEIEITKLPSRSRVDWSRLFKEKIVRELPEQIKKVPLADPGTEAIINDYADKLFPDIDIFLVEDGMDPYELPDFHESFDYKEIIDFTGELDLTNGWLSDISTARRGGDVIVTYSTDNKFLEVNVPISFDDMQFTYDYVAELMGLGPTGYVDGKVSDVTVDAKLGFHTDTLQFSLDDFVITHAGTIEVSFQGSDLLDSVLNILVPVVVNLLEPLLELVLDDVVRGGLNSAVDNINSELNNFLNPPPAADAAAASFLR